MSEARQDPPDQEPEDTAYQLELQGLTRSLNEAAAHLEQSGPVPPDELRRALREVFAEQGEDFEA